MAFAYSKRTSLSPVPDVGEVAGKATGNDEHGVDPDIVAVPCITWCKLLRGHCDTAKAVFVERPSGRVLGIALLDLDESERSAAPGDEVDFAAWHPGAAGQNPPAP
jgi:hypothetical protein